MQLVIISGRSGSGKSIALQALEDLGFYAIDNLPAVLLDSLVDALQEGETQRSSVAVSIDARNLPGALRRFPSLLEAVDRRGVDSQVVYLTAEAKILLERYSATRRRHPLTRDSDMTLAEAIDSEEEALAEIRDLADLVIDTSRLSVHDLRARIAEQVAQHTGKQLTLTFESFGYKRGVPLDADTVFDARCLPNPYWDPRLRSFTGRDVEIVEFLERYPDVDDMAKDIATWLKRWLPAYQASHRSYVTVAIGCTGGQHRSVYLAERLASHFATDYPGVRLRHRELGIHTALLPSPSGPNQHEAT
ncbi:nucleotide-binding protein [Litchfieldella qijiaojingensis]|uniref:Nucleotide-binding protein n=1 Tax=Litchfieldella qijiaojingensis TaxID=980347 RepID=A0ABQ2YHP5_9GAMM|nr:RNase adapter RapZ [Halomonas qijiaojingensis]GGX81932.1 nucleotide-binding protein [Halomonas qijiaojingensis]